MNMVFTPTLSPGVAIADGPPPHVSVVMAVYNGAQFLDAALWSVRRQSLREIEILVVDDASNDDSVQIVRRHSEADVRVRLFALEGNCGPAGARNIALDAARGEWLAVVDCDDLLHPQRLEQLVAEARLRQSDIIADDLTVFSEDDSKPTHPLLGYQVAQQINLPTYLASNQLFGEGAALGYLKPLFRMAFLHQTRLRYDETLRVAEDYDLVARSLAYGASFVVVPNRTYFYRKHVGSISHRLTRSKVLPMVASQDRFEAEFAPLPADVYRALSDRRRSLQRAIAFDDLLNALKMRNILGFLAAGWRVPSALWLLRLPLQARLARIWPARRATADCNPLVMPEV